VSEHPKSPGPARSAEGGRRALLVEDFLDEPTRDLEAWSRLWTRDLPFPVRSRRKGVLGALAVLARRLVRPIVRFGGGDLWDRQRVTNLILLERLVELDARCRELEARSARLECFATEGVEQVLRHDDALFSRLDQKVDAQRREARELSSQLRAALAVATTAEAPAAALAVHDASLRYAGFEDRQRGTEEEIRQRVAAYLPDLEGRAPVLDLGCGRGEALAVLAAAGVPARGVDASAEMVARCRERGLDAAVGDLFGALAGATPGSLGGVVSFHVVEHLPPASIGRLVHLAYRALAPGGLLILETPNPLSVVVAARSFWLDPTHVRPVHPESLRLLFELAGFDPVEHLELRPFPERERLPEIDLAALPEEQRALADRVNRLRDALDDLLFGHQDYALVGTKPAGAGER
jgi:SAM-dependent methyltransferase